MGRGVLTDGCCPARVNLQSHRKSHKRPEVIVQSQIRIKIQKAELSGFRMSPNLCPYHYSKAIELSSNNCASSGNPRP